MAGPQKIVRPAWPFCDIFSPIMGVNRVALSFSMALIVTLGSGCEDPNAPTGADGSTSEMNEKSDANMRGAIDAGPTSATSPCDTVQCGPNGWCRLTLDNKPLCLCNAVGSSYSGVECSQECTRVTEQFVLDSKSHNVTFNATYDGKPVPPRRDGKKIQIEIASSDATRTGGRSYYLEDGVSASIGEGNYYVRWRGKSNQTDQLVGPESYDEAPWFDRDYGILIVRGDTTFGIDFPKLVRVKGKIEYPYSWPNMQKRLKGPSGNLDLMPEGSSVGAPSNFHEGDGSFDVRLPPGTYNLALRNEGGGGWPLVPNALVVKPTESDVESLIRVPTAKVTVNVNVNGEPLRCDLNCSSIMLNGSSLALFPRQVAVGRFEFIAPAGRYQVEFSPRVSQYPFAGSARNILGTIAVPGNADVSYDVQYVKLAGEVKVDGVAAGQTSDLRFRTVVDGFRVDNAIDQTFTAYAIAGIPIRFQVSMSNGAKGSYSFEPRVFQVGDDKVTLDIVKVRAKVSVAYAPANLMWPSPRQNGSNMFAVTIVPAWFGNPDSPAWGPAQPTPFDDFIPAGPHWIGYQFGDYGWYPVEKVTLDAATPTYSGTVNLVELNTRVTVDGKPIPIPEFGGDNPNVRLIRKGTNFQTAVRTSATGEIKVPLPFGDYFVFVEDRGMVGCITIGAKP